MRNVFWLVLCLSLFGCATPYKKSGWKGGYTDFKVQDDIFKVGFKGNAKCSLERAEDFCLLRCAEVTIENGYKYFIILDERSGTQTGAYTTPATANTHGTSYGGTYQGTTNIYGGQTYIYHKPSTRNTIKCFREKPENIPTIIYDAIMVKKNIRNQYKLGKKNNGDGGK
ncbi:MAG: hypothetical protein HY919_07580 [Elusimicrobia bacterium]|nr:hypothetical protein [Elusimicrobiota bacterium]